MTRRCAYCGRRIWLRGEEWRDEWWHRICLLRHLQFTAVTRALLNGLRRAL